MVLCCACASYFYPLALLVVANSPPTLTKTPTGTIAPGRQSRQRRREGSGGNSAVGAQGGGPAGAEGGVFAGRRAQMAAAKDGGAAVGGGGWFSVFRVCVAICVCVYVCVMISPLSAHTSPTQKPTHRCSWQEDVVKCAQKAEEAARALKGLEKVLKEIDKKGEELVAAARERMEERKAEWESAVVRGSWWWLYPDTCVCVCVRVLNQ